MPAPPHASPDPAAPRRGSGAWLYGSPHLLLVLTMLFWSGNFIVGRAVGDSVPPVALAFWRWAVGLMVVLPFAWPHLRRDRATLWAAMPMLLLLSVLGVTAFNTFVYIGLQSTTAVNGVLMQSTMPVAILLCSFLLFGEVPGWRQAVAVAVSLAGVAVIVSRGDPAGLLDTAFVAGDLWLFAAVLVYALYSVLLVRRPMVHPSSFIAITFLLGALVLAPFYALEHAAGQVMRLDLPSLAAVGYVGLFPSVLAYFCYTRAVELIGANQAGQFIHLMPVFGTIMAVVILGETFRSFHALGAGLILCGILLAARRRPPPPA